MEARNETKQRSASNAYTLYHPRWYRPRVSVYWWIGQRQYLKFILRELSSVFVAIFVLMTLFQLRALQLGPESYERFQSWLQTPTAIVLNVVGLFFVVFHTITWFNLAPHAMAIRFRGRRLPAIMIAGTNYLAWIAVSALVVWFIWR